MCGGPSGTQQQLQKSEADFYQNQIAAYNTAYKNFTDIQNTLKAQFAPVLAAGIGQFGYTPDETTALRTQATEGTAQGYAAAQRALQQRIATQGGGTSNVNLTGGPSAQIQEELASTGAQTSAAQNLGITTSGYELGRQNWLTAANAYENMGTAWNPNAFSSSTTNAASPANAEANTIAQQGTQIWGSVLGALGGIGGTMAGGWAQGGFKGPGGAKGGGGSYVNPGTMGVSAPGAGTF